MGGSKNTSLNDKHLVIRSITKSKKLMKQLDWYFDTPLITFFKIPIIFKSGRYRTMKLKLWDNFEKMMRGVQNGHRIVNMEAFRSLDWFFHTL